MSETNHTERRQHERTLLEKEITLATAAKNGTKYHDAVTVDLSPQGVRVRSKVKLTPGESVEIVADGISDLPHVVHSQVVWMARGEAGLQFAEPVQIKGTQRAKRAMVV